MRLESFGRTELGGGQENQDALCVRSELGLFAIADGIGGRPGGREASGMALEALAAELGALDEARRAEKPALLAALRSVNATVVQAGVSDTTLAGLGTTLSAVVSGGKKLALLHVGDSAIYRLGGAGLEKLTREHTLALELVTQNRLSEEQAQRHPLRHHLARYIGATGPYEPDLDEVELAPGEWLLLVTDGLHKSIAEAELERLALERSAGGAKAICDGVVERALAHGARDNLTLLVVGRPGSPR
ncbi:MAG: protein phosphatase 2C domain-containing protein [Planctomycetota bacterium]|nr:protein phosphatase 2C domain-containing protein [Planctomycetota bacterium]